MLIFAFATIQDGRAVLSPRAAQRLAAIIALKQRDPTLRVEISIGGWGAGGFSEAARTDASRARFADSAAALVQRHHADGLDIDWEYPGNSDAGIASSPADRHDFPLLLRALRARLDRIAGTGQPPCTISVAVADGSFTAGVDIAAVDRVVDWFNLMTYDFCNSMTPTTCNHTGLHASVRAPADARSAARAARQYLAAGVAPGKLMLGVAFYGRAFSDVDPVGDGLYQPYRHYVGEIPWPRLREAFIGRQGFARHWDARADAPWLWNPASRTFVTYDDPESIKAKAAYVRRHRLGGIMYWEQSLDPGGQLLDAIAQRLHARRKVP